MGWLARQEDGDNSAEMPLPQKDLRHNTGKSKEVIEGQEGQK